MRMGIFGGNVGIGTTAPRPGVRLEVNGATVITPGNGLEMQLGAPNGETGLTLSKPTAPTARADVRFDGTTLKLFASTGLVPPGNGITIGTSGGATVTGTNGDGAVLTARRSGGDSFAIIDAAPASQNSVLAYRKNNLNRWLMFADSIPESGGNTGSDFQLDAYNDAGGGIANYLFIKRSTGNVGIGTTGPATRLAVNGGPTWTSNGWIGSLSMGNASALGWEANPSGQRSASVNQAADCISSALIVRSARLAVRQITICKLPMPEIPRNRATGAAWSRRWRWSTPLHRLVRILLAAITRYFLTAQPPRPPVEFNFFIMQREDTISISASELMTASFQPQLL